MDQLFLNNQIEILNEIRIFRELRTVEKLSRTAIKRLHKVFSVIASY